MVNGVDRDDESVGSIFNKRYTIIMTNSPHILVVGGAGYIGSHVAKYLHNIGERAVVLDNLVSGNAWAVNHTPFVQGDMQDQMVVKTIVNQYNVEEVMLFASYINVGESVHNPAKYYQNNVGNMIQFLDAVKQSSVKRVLFSSTCAVYGDPLTIPMDEAHVKAPINPYGRCKSVIEDCLLDFEKAYGLTIGILRYFNAAGASEDGELGEIHNPETHLIPRAILAAMGYISKIDLFGDTYATEDGTCIRDFIHVTDLAEVHMKVLELCRNNSTSISLNCGTGHGYSVKQVIHMVEKVLQKTVPYEQCSAREGDAAILLSDVQKMNDVLNWQPQRSDLKTIIEDTWKFYKQNEDKLSRIYGQPRDRH